MTHGPGESPSVGHIFSSKCQAPASTVMGKPYAFPSRAIFTNNQGLCELLLIREVTYEGFLKAGFVN